MGVFVAIFLAGTLFGQEMPPEPPDGDILAVLTERENPWGRFPLKSWIHTQTISWTAQDGPFGTERIASVRETKTTLESMEADGITLKKEVTRNMGGKQIKAAPQVERFDFYREPMEADAVAKNVGTGKLLINNLVIPCKKRVYEKQNDSEKRTTTLWFTTQLYPYVLRAETVLVALPTENSPLERELRRSVMEVYESSSFQLRRSKDGVYRYRIKTTEGKMTTLTDASGSLSIPGGVIHETVRELDAAGAEIRTAETRIINYSFATPTPEPPMSLLPGALPYPYSPMVRPRWRRFYPMPPSLPYAPPTTFSPTTPTTPTTPSTPTLAPMQ
jgi:hypothetical protein